MKKSLVTVITCSLGLAGPIAAADFTFERYDLDTGSSRHQTVLTGFLLRGAMAEVAVVSVDENDRRGLRIYALDDGSWVPEVDAALRPEVMFVDVANIAGRDRLLTYEPGRLQWFDPASATERPLVAVTYRNPPPAGGVPHVDVTRDLNGDGRDDLVVPDLHGFRVFMQNMDGTFADPVTIGRYGEVRWSYGAHGYRHDAWAQGGVHEMDYNLDGRNDLVFWNGRRFEVHLQDERGLFATQTRSFTVDVALERGRNVCSRRPEHGFDAVEVCFEADHSALTFGDRKEQALHSFTDVNGDGVADLVIFSLEGKSVFSVRSTYEVHFGAPTPAGVVAFAPEIGTSIRSEGMPGWLEQHDLDGDGQVDMTVTALKVGFFKTLGSLLTRSAALDLQVYRMEDGVYADRANLSRKVKIDIGSNEAGEKDAAYASVLIGDVTGDGRADLLVAKGRKELRVFAGVPGPDVFAARPQRVAVAVPNDERYTWLVDLDRDGKQDVLVHHPSSTEPQRMTTLIAR